jgi:hypothetical protein
MGLFIKKHYGEEKAKLFFLNTAIVFSKMLSSGKLKMNKKSGKELSSPDPVNTAIVAGQKKFNECLHLIKYASFPLVICGRIAVDSRDREAAIGKITSIKADLKKNEIKQIVFCEGEQSFKTIIKQIETVPVSVTALLTAENSSCIIGSSDKNTKGIFIAKQ